MTVAPGEVVVVRVAKVPPHGVFDRGEEVLGEVGPRFVGGFGGPVEGALQGGGAVDGGAAAVPFAGGFVDGEGGGGPGGGEAGVGGWRGGEGEGEGVGEWEEKEEGEEGEEGEEEMHFQRVV